MIQRLCIIALFFALLSCTKNEAPHCQITFPTAIDPILYSDTINVTINAEDPDGTISKIQVFLNEQKLASLNEAPYTFNLYPDNYFLGRNLLKAVAFDDKNAESTSEIQLLIGFIPIVETHPVTNIRTHSAGFNGSVTSSIGETETGFYLSLSASSEKTGSKIIELPVDDIFATYYTELQSGTEYHIRAFGTNPFGSSLGEEIKFHTVSQSLPVVGVPAISMISYTSVNAGVIIVNDGNSDITTRGFCWNPVGSPTIADQNSEHGSGASDFSGMLTDLTNGTTYFIRAFATNEKGIAYGMETSFTTLSFELPVITSTEISDTTFNSVKCGGQVLSDGGQEVTERGICWSTSANPTISDSKLSDVGSGIGSFESSLINLSPETHYFLRAFAVNALGTAYGEELSFTTLAEPNVRTSLPFSTDNTSVILGGRVLENGGYSVVERGFYFGSTSNPVSNGTKTMVGSGLGYFSSEFTDLSTTTPYFVVSYAKNSSGTFFGEEIEFIIQDQSPGTVTDLEGKTYETLKYGTQTWMAENLATTKYNDDTNISHLSDPSSWISTQVGAFCWFNNDHTNKQTRGALYNYAAVESGKLCPSGWHVPSDDEWKTLEKLIGMSVKEVNKKGFRGEEIGGKFKEAGTNNWLTPNLGATNMSGFTVIPSGIRETNSSFLQENSRTMFWTTTHYFSSPFYRAFSYDKSSVERSDVMKSRGLSVRCIKDE